MHMQYLQPSYFNKESIMHRVQDHQNSESKLMLGFYNHESVN